MFLLKLLREHRKVIISYRNSGFGDNLIAAAAAWRYAKCTNRALVIFWQNSRYLADKRENAFTHFFKVPESIDGVPVIAEPRMDRPSALLIFNPYIFSPRPDPLLILKMVLGKLRLNTVSLFKQRWRRRQQATDRIINDLTDVKRSIIVTHGCYVPDENLRPFFNALQLQPEFRKEVDEFAEKHFRNKKVIGVHIRYYNQSMLLSDHTKYWLDHAKALAVCLDKIKEAVEESGKSEYVIFLCTDSRLVHDFVTRSMGNVVTYEKEFGNDSSRELHEELPEETAAATVIEMFLLARSEILVRFPPGSWFSHYASLFAKKIIT